MLSAVKHTVLASWHKKNNYAKMQMQMENIICDCHHWANYVPVVTRTNIDFSSNDANSWKKR
jgi:hypothetical protein